MSATTGALSWKYETHSGVSASATPAVVSGAVYFGADDNNVYALNAANGEPFMEVHNRRRRRQSAHCGQRSRLLSSEDSNLYALDAKTGVLLWKYALPMGGRASAGGCQRLAWSTSSGVTSNVYALNAHTGVLLWEFVITGGSGVFTTPTVFQGVAYVASDVGMFALNALTGAVIWENAKIQINISSPAIANGVLYIGWNDSVTAPPLCPP